MNRNINILVLLVMVLSGIVYSADYVFEDTGKNYEVGGYGLNISPEEAVRMEGGSILVNVSSGQVSVNKNVSVDVESTNIIGGDLHINAGTLTDKSFGDTYIGSGSVLWVETDQEGYYPDGLNNPAGFGNVRTEIEGNIIKFGSVISDGDININNNRHLWVSFPQNATPAENATGSVSALMDSLTLNSGSKLTMVGNAFLEVGDLILGNNSVITLQYYLLNPYIEHNGLQPIAGYEIIDYTMCDGITRPLVTVTGNMSWDSGSWTAADMLFTSSSVLDYKNSTGALDTGYRAWRNSSGEATYYLPRIQLMESMTLSLNDMMKSELYDNINSEWSELSRTKLVQGYVVGGLGYNDIILSDEYEMIYDQDYSEFIENVNFNGLTLGNDYRLELNNGEVYLWAKMSNIVPETSVSMMLLLSLIPFCYRRRH